MINLGPTLHNTAQIHRTLNTVYDKAAAAEGVVRTVHCGVQLQCSICAVCSVQCAECTVQCTLCTPRRLVVRSRKLGGTYQIAPSCCSALWHCLISEYYIHHHQEDYTILCIDSQCFTFIHGTKQIIPWCRDVFVLHQDDKRRQQTRKDRATQPIREGWSHQN